MSSIHCIDCNNCIVYLKQITQEYPKILTPDNEWIIGITQEPSTQAYYLIFYHEIPIHLLLNKVIQDYKHVQYMQYSDFDEIKEIGSGGYGTVYTAKYKGGRERMPETVVLKRFNNFAAKVFISEVSVFDSIN